MSSDVQEHVQNEQAEKKQRQKEETTGRLYKNDPVLYLLKERWHLRTRWIVGGITLLVCIISFGLEALSGGFLYGIKLHYAIRLLLQTFVLFPLTALIYVSLPASILQLFELLKSRDIIGEPRKEKTSGETYEQVLGRLVSWQSSKWWTLSALLLVAVYILYRFGIVDVIVPNNSPLWLRIPVVAIYSTTIYAVFLSIVRLLLGWFVLNRVFSAFQIHVAPWHPDGSAGLGILDEMLVRSSWLMLLLGMAVVAVHSSLLSANPTIFSLTQALGLGLTYIVLTPILVFGWLWLSRKALIEARSAALQPLGQQLQQELQTILASPTNDQEQLKARLDRLDEMKRLYEFTRDAYPIWPATIVQVKRSLFVVISLSAAIPVITFLVPIISGLANALH